MGGRVMRRRIFLLSLVLALPQLTPAANQNRFIVRTTLGLQSLTQLCLLPTLGCSVVAALDGGLNQLFLLTTLRSESPDGTVVTLASPPTIESNWSSSAETIPGVALKVVKNTVGSTIEGVVRRKS